MLFTETTESICRTCLSTEGELISLYSDASDDAHLTSKIRNISDVTINERDGLPYMICRKCIFLVESFDCFKKQIQSANKKIHAVSCTRNDQLNISETRAEQPSGNPFANEKEKDDSDYEVQYISEEVKNKVEKAFKRRQESSQQRKLDDTRTTLKRIREVVLHPNKHTIEEKNGSDYFKDEKINIEHNDVSLTEEKNFQRNITTSLVAVDADENEFEKKLNYAASPISLDGKVASAKNFDAAESKTFPSVYSDCNPRLIIVTEEPEDPGNRSSGSEGDGVEENLDCLTSQLETETSNKGKCNANGNLGAEETGGNWRTRLKSISWDSVEEKKDSELETEKTESPDGTAMIIPAAKAPIIDENQSFKLDPFHEKFPSWPEESKEGEEKNSGSRKTAAHEDEAMDDDRSRQERKEETMTIENRRGIGTEVTRLKRFDKDENKVPKTGQKHNAEEEEPSACVFDNSDKNKGPLGVSSLKNIENDSPVSFAPLENKCIDDVVSETTEPIADLSECSQPRFISVKKCYDKKFEDGATTGREIPCAVAASVHGTDDTSGAATSRETVIVISSDSSDEERRNDQVETKNQRGIVTLPRKKIFQSRLVVKKIPTSHGHEKKRRESVQENSSSRRTTSIQTRKYFQCTSCNVNLYSVSAVLHHHNQIHTPPQELMHCMMCDVKFPTKTILRAHFDQHVESHLFRCTYCTCEFVLRRNLRAHMNAHAIATRPKSEEQPELKRRRIVAPIASVELPVQRDIESSANDEIPDTNSNVDSHVCSRDRQTDESPANDQESRDAAI